MAKKPPSDTPSPKIEEQDPLLAYVVQDLNDAQGIGQFNKARLQRIAAAQGITLIEEPAIAELQQGVPEHTPSLDTSLNARFEALVEVLRNSTPPVIDADNWLPPKARAKNNGYLTFAGRVIHAGGTTVADLAKIMRPEEQHLAQDSFSAMQRDQFIDQDGVARTDFQHFVDFIDTTGGLFDQRALQEYTRRTGRDELDDTQASMHYDAIRSTLLDHGIINNDGWQPLEVRLSTANGQYRSALLAVCLNGWTPETEALMPPMDDFTRQTLREASAHDHVTGLSLLHNRNTLIEFINAQGGRFDTRLFVDFSYHVLGLNIPEPPLVPNEYDERAASHCRDILIRNGDIDADGWRPFETRLNAQNAEYSRLIERIADADALTPRISGSIPGNDARRARIRDGAIFDGFIADNDQSLVGHNDPRYLQTRGVILAGGTGELTRARFQQINGAEASLHVASSIGTHEEHFVDVDGQISRNEVSYREIGRALRTEELGYGSSFTNILDRDNWPATDIRADNSEYQLAVQRIAISGHWMDESETGFRDDRTSETIPQTEERLGEDPQKRPEKRPRVGRFVYEAPEAWGGVGIPRGDGWWIPPSADIPPTVNDRNPARLARFRETLEHDGIIDADGNSLIGRNDAAFDRVIADLRASGGEFTADRLQAVSGELYHSRILQMRFEAMRTVLREREIIAANNQFVAADHGSGVYGPAYYSFTANEANIGVLVRDREVTIEDLTRRGLSPEAAIVRMQDWQNDHIIGRELEDGRAGRHRVLNAPSHPDVVALNTFISRAITGGLLVNDNTITTQDLVRVLGLTPDVAAMRMREMERNGIIGAELARTSKDDPGGQHMVLNAPPLPTPSSTMLWYTTDPSPAAPTHASGNYSAAYYAAVYRLDRAISAGTFVSAASITSLLGCDVTTANTYLTNMVQDNIMRDRGNGLYEILCFPPQDNAHLPGWPAGGWFADNAAAMAATPFTNEAMAKIGVIWGMAGSAVTGRGKPPHMTNCTASSLNLAMHHDFAGNLTAPVEIAIRSSGKVDIIGPRSGPISDNVQIKRTLTEIALLGPNVQISAANCPRADVIRSFAIAKALGAKPQIAGAQLGIGERLEARRIRKDEIQPHIDAAKVESLKQGTWYTLGKVRKWKQPKPRNILKRVA